MTLQKNHFKHSRKDLRITSDDLISNENLLTLFNEDEQHVIQNSIHQENSNIKNTIQRLRHNPEMLQDYTISHFS